MRFQKTQVITIANQKGGCGKTTTSVSLAAAFATLGYEACVVDVEPQCNATMTFKLNPDELLEQGKFTAADMFLEGIPATEIRQVYERAFERRVSVVPGNFYLPTVSVLLNDKVAEAVYTMGADKAKLQLEDLHLLRRSIDSLRGVVDVVLIDTPPGLDFITASALIAADWFLVPVLPSGYDLSGLERFINEVDVYRDKYNPGLRFAGVLLVAANKITNQFRGVYDILVRDFGREFIFKTAIGLSIKFQEAAGHRVTIFEHPDGKGIVDQYIELAKELLTRSAHGASVDPLPSADSLRRVGNG